MIRIRRNINLRKVQNLNCLKSTHKKSLHKKSQIIKVSMITTKTQNQEKK